MPRQSRRFAKRLRLLPVQVVDPLLVHPPDEQHVLEAPIGDEDDARAVALDHGVGRDGGPDDQPVDPMRPLEPGQTGRERLARIARRGRHLGRRDRAGAVVDQDEIGERPAGVDAEDDAHRAEAASRGGRKACVPASGRTAAPR